MIEDAIVAALPHNPACVTVLRGDKCSCGATAKRAVLYTQVQMHVQRLTKGRVYLS